MASVKTCIIFDAMFENERGLGVAFLEDEKAARMSEEDLREDGFRAALSGGREGPKRFWYLKTNAPIGELWCVVGCFFDAYIRFQARPGEGLEIRESCACAGCRDAGDDSLYEFVESPACPKPDGERADLPEFDRVILK